MMRRGAFTLTEIVIAVFVMLIVSVIAVMSPLASEQKAKHEAERVAAYLYRMEQRADRMRQNFNIDTFTDYILIKWPGGMSNEDRTFKASNGCTYSDNFGGRNGEGTYNARKKQFSTGGTINVYGADGDLWYVIIASTEGRIRVSDIPPD